MSIILIYFNYLTTHRHSFTNTKVKVKVVTKKTTFWQEFRNTNPLVATKNFIVSKTGFISKSGGCIVMMLETAKGIRTVILLGSKSTKTRIPEASLVSSID